MKKNYQELEKWLNIGHEVEFTFQEKRYSITYGRDSNRKRFISFCEFYQPDTEFYSVEDFLENAKIGDQFLKNIWDQVKEIDVF